MHDTSAGKNLVRTMTTSATATNGVSVALTTVAGTTCGSTSLSPYSGAVGSSFVVCATVTVPPTVTATSAMVTITTLGQQKIDGIDKGWSATSTGTIPVTISTLLTCPSSSSASGGTLLTWTLPTGATGSQLQYLNNSTWTPIANATSPYSVGSVGNKDATRTFRVAYTGGATATSNQVTVTQSNNGNNNQTCVGGS